MDLICYLHEAWKPYLRPAPATRPWMDATPEAFAYRCLPLNIANAHGWELLNPHGFEAEWNGGQGVDAVTIRPDSGPPPVGMATSLFGQGVLTFHVEGLFRTPKGWNLWIGGSPNRAKDAIAPLTGVVETDWSPFTFTMNWRFTRPHARVRFEAMEPFGFVFPLVRQAVGAFKPRFEPLESNPELAEQFAEWSRSRDDFHERMRQDPGDAPSARWQKHYYRGRDAGGQEVAEDHMGKLRLSAFDVSATPDVPEAPRDDAGLPPDPVAPSVPLAQRRREWVMEAMERQRALSPALIAIERREALTSAEFLERYYAPGRPVLLGGEMAGWPALERWNADYLKAHAAEPEVLATDIGRLGKFLAPQPEARHSVSLSAAGSLEPLRQGLANTLTAQIAGRRRILLLPPSEVGRLYEDDAGASRIVDLESDTTAFTKLSGARAYAVELVAGDILYVPLGWWRQDRALDDAVAITFSNFHWSNDAAEAFPRMEA
jgi:hypothetical protein